MAPRLRPLASAIAALLVLTVLAGAFPPASAERHGECSDRDPTCDVKIPDECRKEGTAHAAIANVLVNGVVLQTQAGSTTLELPRGLLRDPAGVSTTGNLDVEVKHRCVMWYSLTWTVVGQLSTTSGSFVSHPLCVGGTDVHSIPVGNDVAHVHIELFWSGCDGTSGKDQRDIKVIDPALPL